MKNYFSLMAWSNPSGKEFFTSEEMMNVFNLSDIQTTAPVFDQEKLRWMNGEYLRKKTDEELMSLLTSENKPMVKNILPLIRDRMKTLSEFESLAGFFFEKPTVFERPIEKKILQVGLDALQHCDWTHDALEKAIRDTAGTTGLKAKDVFMELRVAVTGKTVGPPLLESFVILGKDEVEERLQKIVIGNN
jgi:glutamyl/glutaminyl-tRNA synthetase